ncbi:MAG: ankyrin repeat domain-containing protein [Legionellaceae bacterium]|nr:ankyrin repeat domain-containing protein [Legionellaceae bacterium]
MSQSFQVLCAELGLHPESGDEHQLRILRQWCEAHISQDIVYTGTSVEQYSQYIALVKDYLEVFQENIPDELTMFVPQWDDWSTLQYAAYQGYDRYIASLSSVDSRAWNQGNAAGMTALHFAALQGHIHTLELLLARGADPHIENYQKQLPIYSALVLPVWYADGLMEKKEKIFLLLKNAESVMHPDASGDTVLHLMAMHGYEALSAEIVRDYPALVLECNHWRHYPIHTAILNAQLPVARILLALPGVAEQADGHGRVPLHYAACYGSEEMVTLCCETAADRNIHDSEGKTAKMLAHEQHNVEAIKVLG